MDQQLFLILFLIHLNLSSSQSPSSSSSSSSRNHPKTVIYHLVTNGKSADKKHNDLRHSHGILGQSVTWTPPIATTSPPSSTPVNIVSYSWRETGFTDCSLSCLGGIQENIIHCIRDNDSMIVSQYLCNIEDKPESITVTCNDQPCPPRYHVGDWGQCVGTCGSGVRTRSVECKILLDFSKMYSIMPDDQCPGIKPESTESCSLPPCSSADDLDDDQDNQYLPGNYAALIAYSSSSSSSTTTPTSTSTANSVSYYWQDSGFTECSASCLGGTQESIIQCVRDNDTMIVSHYLCNIEEKPDSMTKTCNDHPCPPRWTTSEFGPCSKPCGAGVQIREVKCIHEVTRGLENALHVPHHQCTEAKPIEERVCNEDPCPSTLPPHPPPPPPIDKWSEGGRGKGVTGKCKGENCLLTNASKKKRKCNKDSTRSSSMSTSHSSKCNKKRNHKGATECKSGSKCKSRLDGTVGSDNNTLNPVQSFIQTSNEKRVTLRIGGTAVIYEGTILKIRCPRKKMENGLLPEIEWTKNDLPIDYDDRISLTRLGTLKIADVDFTDSATYTCIHGATRLSMNVQVVAFKPLLPSSSTLAPPTYLENGVSVNYAIEMPELSNSPIEYNGQLKTSAPYETEPKQSIKKLTALINALNKKNGQSTADQKTPKTLHLVTIEPEKDSIYYADQQANQLSLNISTVYSPADWTIILVSGKNPSNGGQFYWLVSPWSTCSTPCNIEGTMVRAIKCIESVGDKTLEVHEKSCLRYGVERPETNRICKVDCNKWTTGPWGECNLCTVGHIGQGMHQRSVNCTSPSGQTLDPTQCNSGTNPGRFQYCSNPDCRPMWLAKPWSPCSGVCGKLGTQKRSHDCVWLANRDRPASNCDENNKPLEVRKCRVNCDKNINDDNSDKQDCFNVSFLCKYAVPQSCGHPVFRSSCCQSCRDDDFLSVKSSPSTDKVNWDNQLDEAKN